MSRGMALNHPTPTSLQTTEDTIPPWTVFRPVSIEYIAQRQTQLSIFIYVLLACMLVLLALGIWVAVKTGRGRKQGT